MPHLSRDLDSGDARDAGERLARALGRAAVARLPADDRAADAADRRRLARGAEPGRRVHDAQPRALRVVPRQRQPRVDAFSMRCFWARFVVPLDDRLYASVYWWSIDDMVRATIASEDDGASLRKASKRRSAAVLAGSVEEWEALPRQEQAHRCAQRASWSLALEGPASCYDLTVDPGELDDLARAPGWPGSALAATLHAAAAAAMRHHGLADDVRLHLPEGAHASCPTTWRCAPCRRGPCSCGAPPTSRETWRFRRTRRCFSERARRRQARRGAPDAPRPVPPRRLPRRLPR